MPHGTTRWVTYSTMTWHHMDDVVENDVCHHKMGETCHHRMMWKRVTCETIGWVTHGIIQKMWHRTIDVVEDNMWKHRMGNTWHVMILPKRVIGMMKSFQCNNSGGH